MTVTYNQRTAEPWPDLSHYHYVGDAAKFGAAKPTAIEFKVREEGYVDATWTKHDAIGHDLNIPRLGYEFAHNATAADFLAIFPPAPGRIAVLDAEASDLTLAEAAAWVVGVRKVYGADRVWLYARSWLRGKGIAGTPLASCPSQQAEYNTVLIPEQSPPLKVAVWQYAGGGSWPVPPGAPRTFPGIFPTGANCDMNVLLIPVPEFRKMAGLDQGGDLVLTDADAKQLGYSTVGSWRAQEERAKAVSDVLAGRPKQGGQDEAYNVQYDLTTKKLSGGGGGLTDHKHDLSGFPAGTGSVTP